MPSSIRTLANKCTKKLCNSKTSYMLAPICTFFQPAPVSRSSAFEPWEIIFRLADLELFMQCQYAYVQTKINRKKAVTNCNIWEYYKVLSPLHF